MQAYALPVADKSVPCHLDVAIIQYLVTYPNPGFNNTSFLIYTCIPPLSVRNRSISQEEEEEREEKEGGES